jgi:hypothetical protein
MRVTDHHVKMMALVLMYMMIIGANAQVIITVSSNVECMFDIHLILILGVNCQSSMQMI